MATLTIERGNADDVGKTFSIMDRPLCVGRANQSSPPDVAVNDRYVSRRHLEIFPSAGRFALRDLGSTNGTSLDELRIEAGKTYVLSQDVLIGLGVSSGAARVVLRFRETPTVSTARIELTGAVVAGLWLCIDRDKQEVQVDGCQVVLARKEYDLICFLDSKVGKTCSRDELIANVWPEADPAGVADAAVDQLVHRLRKKVESDPSRPARIVTRKGFGYVLVKD